MRAPRRSNGPEWRWPSPHYTTLCARVPAPYAHTRFCEFVTASPSPFHAVANLSQRLKKAGFERVSEREPTNKLTPGGKYFYTRNQSALVAFTLPHGTANAASLVAGHCDSPCLKVG